MSCFGTQVTFWGEQMVLIILILNLYIMATNSASRQKKRPKIGSNISVSKWGQICMTCQDCQYMSVCVEGSLMCAWGCGWGLGMWGTCGVCPSMSHHYRPTCSCLWRPIASSLLLHIHEGHHLVPFAQDIPSGLWFLTRQQAALAYVRMGSRICWLPG